MTFDILLNNIIAAGNLFGALTWPYIVATLVALVAAWFCAMDKLPLGSGVASTIAIGILAFNGVFSPFVPVDFTFATHYAEVTKIVALYATVGLLWAIFRWTVLLLRRKADGGRYAPDASDYKALISLWFLYWPLSVVYFTLKTAVVDSFNFLWLFVGGILNGLSNLIFKGKE